MEHCTNPLRGTWVARPSSRMSPPCEPELAISKSGANWVIVARHERHNLVSLPHCYRPQDFSVAPADDRRHDGAQLCAQHHDGVPQTGQLLRPTFWQVTGTIGARRNPQLPDLSSQGAESGGQQPDGD